MQLVVSLFVVLPCSDRPRHSRRDVSCAADEACGTTSGIDWRPDRATLKDVRARLALNSRLVAERKIRQHHQRARYSLRASVLAVCLTALISLEHVSSPLTCSRVSQRQSQIQITLTRSKGGSAKLIVLFGVPPPPAELLELLCEPPLRRAAASLWKTAGCLRMDLGVEIEDTEALGVGVPNCCPARRRSGVV